MSKLIAILILIAALTSMKANAGARVELDHINKIAKVKMKSIFYGNIQLASIADIMKIYTERAWNGQGLMAGDVPTATYLTHQSQRYKIQSTIETQVMTTQDALNLFNSNTDASINFHYTNYGKNGGGYISYVVGLGLNCGYLELNMQLDTLAHELGHSLYMAHVNGTGSRLPLMYPWVDPSTVLQEDDTRQLRLGAPNTDGSYTVGELCDRSQFVDYEPEDGDSWDFVSLSDSPIAAVKIYPNPVPQGQAPTAEFSSTRDGAVEAQLFDMKGRLVGREMLGVIAGTNKAQIKGISRQPRGMYILKLATGSKKDLGTKIIVQ